MQYEICKIRVLEMVLNGIGTPPAFLPLFTKENNCCTVKTLNIGTPRLTTVVVLNIKQFNFTMK